MCTPDIQACCIHPPIYVCALYSNISVKPIIYVCNMLLGAYEWAQCQLHFICCMHGRKELFYLWGKLVIAELQPFTLGMVWSQTLQQKRQTRIMIVAYKTIQLVWLFLVYVIDRLTAGYLTQLCAHEHKVTSDQGLANWVSNLLAFRI